MLPIVFLFIFFCQKTHTYKFPEAKLEAFEPSGFRFSIPDEYGMNLVALHAKKNDEIVGIEAGDISVDISKPKDGRWIYENKDLRLKIGDVINYWVHVQENHIGYNNLDRTWTVTEYSNEGFPYKRKKSTTDRPARPPHECPDAVTTVNGQYVCPDKLIFQENFDTNTLNISRWRWQQRIAEKPDYKFVTYMKDESIGYIQDHWLIIEPQLVPDEKIEARGEFKLDECTAISHTECGMRAYSYRIFPPVKSARLSSDLSFNFKYGTIKIEAQLPKGDWLTPEIWLTPKKDIYGPINDLVCGQIRIAFSRGNIQFKDHEGLDHGCRMLHAGILLGDSGHILKKLPYKLKPDGCWSDEPHIFELTWKPEYLEFRVDDRLITRISPPNRGWKSLKEWGEDNEIDPWSSGTKIAPFDQEFYIELGVGAGGFEDFPDFPSVSKPWKNEENKATLHFYEKRNEWFSTWTQGKLKVKSIKVWSV